MIGKGYYRSDAVVEAMKKNLACVYMVAIGGAGALISIKHQKKCKCWPIQRT